MKNRKETVNSKIDDIITYIALHCLTIRNFDDHFFDTILVENGYYPPECSNLPKDKEKILKYLEEYENSLPNNIRPSNVNRATGQVDLPLILKGEKLSKLIADQIIKEGNKVDKIYSSGQKRCRQTACCVAQQIYEKTGKKCQIIMDTTGSLDAQSYGLIAKYNKPIDELKHFWRYKYNPENITYALLYLIAPKLIGAERKSHFRERVYRFINFINDKDVPNEAKSKIVEVWEVDDKNPKNIIRSQKMSNLNFDNSLIIGGSDILSLFLKTPGICIDKQNLHRGELSKIVLPNKINIETKLNKLRNKIPFLPKAREGEMAK